MLSDIPTLKCQHSQKTTGSSQGNYIMWLCSITDKLPAITILHEVINFYYNTYVLRVGGRDTCVEYIPLTCQGVGVIL